MAKPHKGTSICLVLFLIFFNGLALPAPAGNQKTLGPVTITGRLHKAAAIGGETPGWVLVLDAPLVTDSQSLRRIEVDPGDRKIARFQDRRVEIQGTLQKYSGIERGSYWVMVLKEIQEITPGK